jgi:hypothetical protein
VLFSGYGKYFYNVFSLQMDYKNFCGVKLSINFIGFRLIVGVKKRKKLENHQIGGEVEYYVM